MSIQFCKQKFHLAIFDLVAPGNIRSRMEAAWSQHLIHLDPVADLPELSANDFKNLKSMILEHIHDKLENISEFEVEKLAQETVNLYEKILQEN